MEKKKKKFKVSIRFKGILMIFVFAFVIVEVAVAYYAISISSRNKKHYLNAADSFSQSMTEVVNIDDFAYLKEKVDTIFQPLESIPDDNSSKEDMDAYLAKYQDVINDPKYETTRSFLKKMVNTNKSNYVDCSYLGYVSKKNGKDYIVYIADSDETDNAVYPGVVEEIDKKNKEVVGKPERGFPAYETKSKYGHLIISGSPLEKDGSVIGYVFVDISMTAVRKSQASAIIRLFSYLVITIALIAVVGVVLVHLIFVRHLNKLNKVAKSYSTDRPEETHRAFINLKIHTHDEIEELADSIKLMESDINLRLKQLTEMNNELMAHKKHAEEMSILANKDGLTGVKNKAAYNNEVEILNKAIALKEKVAFGIVMVDLNYLKNTNDEYGHDAGDEALIKLTNLICETFKHSPVYRIGGDEFVAILKNNDLMNVQRLLYKFNAGVDSSLKGVNLPDNEKISAAIGFARFNSKTDRSVEDVFKRADKAMYDRKREMKNN